MLIIPKYENILPVIEADPNQQVYSSSRHYSVLYKHLFLPRLKMVLRLMGNEKYDNLLDAGFGSGIFLPELGARCERLVGVDLHSNAGVVKQMSVDEGLDAELVSADLTILPFGDKLFDCVVSLSVLEFVEDIEGAFSELRRVAAPGAKVVIGAPVLNRFTAQLYTMVGFKKHKSVHKADQDRILRAARKFFTVRKIITFPALLPLDLSLYFAAELTD